MDSFALRVRRPSTLEEDAAVASSATKRQVNRERVERTRRMF